MRRCDVELPGGESGNIEHTWGMYNKPQAAVHPLTWHHTHKQKTKGEMVAWTDACFIFGNFYTCFVYYLISTAEIPQRYVKYYVILYVKCVKRNNN
jgi:hypothetical protein